MTRSLPRRSDLGGLAPGTRRAYCVTMSKHAIIVSEGPLGSDFIGYLDLAGFFPLRAPPSHRYADIRGPFRLYLVDGTLDQLRDAAQLHGRGGQFDLASVGSGPEAPAASVIFYPDTGGSSESPS